MRFLGRLSSGVLIVPWELEWVVNSNFWRLIGSWLRLSVMFLIHSFLIVWRLAGRLENELLYPITRKVSKVEGRFTSDCFDLEMERCRKFGGRWSRGWSILYSIFKLVTDLGIKFNIKEGENNAVSKVSQIIFNSVRLGSEKLLMEWCHLKGIIDAVTDRRLRLEGNENGTREWNLPNDSEVRLGGKRVESTASKNSVLKKSIIR